MPIKFKPTRKTATDPGMGGTLYLAVLDTFDEIAEPPTVGVAAGDTTTIVDDHTFLTVGGKAQGFIKIPLMNTNKNKYGFKLSGESPAQITTSEFEGIAVGLDAAQIEWIQELKGKPVIALVEDAECQSGRIVQVGCKCRPINSIGVEWMSSDNELKITGSAPYCMLKDYKGVITEITV